MRGVGNFKTKFRSGYEYCTVCCCCCISSVHCCIVSWCDGVGSMCVGAGSTQRETLSLLFLLFLLLVLLLLLLLLLSLIFLLVFVGGFIVDGVGVYFGCAKRVLLWCFFGLKFALLLQNDLSSTSLLLSLLLKTAASPSSHFCNVTGLCFG